MNTTLTGALATRNRMMAKLLAFGFLVPFLSCACLPSIAAAQAGQEEVFSAEARGFGHVDIVARLYDAGSRSWTTFRAEDAAHAKLCASKRLADLLGFGDLKPVAEAKLPGTVLQIEGAGAWLLGVQGAEFHELVARDLAGLQALAVAAKADAWEKVAERAYPRWLDCFDNAGPGVWVGGGGDQYVLPADFEWLRDRKLAMCTLSPTESRLVGPGVLDTTIFDWHTAMAAKYDLPYRVLFFPASHEWLWNRRPLPYVLPEQGRTTVAPWFEYQSNTCAGALEPVPATDPFVNDLRRRLAAHLAPDPNYVGMHGCTEIPEAGVDILSSVSRTPGIKQLWHAYLASVLRMDLSTVGQLHTGDPMRCRSWDEVEVPRPINFLGWDPATCLELRETWQMHEDIERKGEAGGWSDPAKAPTDWVEGDCGDPMVLMYTPQRQSDPAKQPDFWMRRTVTVPAGRAKSLGFLHIGRDVYHGNHTPLFGVWINGKKLEPKSDERGSFDQCFAAGDALQDGENRIVLNTHGAPVSSYCFLGPKELRAYPGMSATENRLWYDAVNFDAWLRVGKIEAQLRATRAADPNRPLKLMAMINLLDLTTPLCDRYGAYQHDTGGAGGYWCPMTGARLARSHGLPWSCEQGGPPHNAADMQSAMTFYLMYGNDAVDLVFAVAHYSGKPDVAAWVDKNLELVRCIGKMHLPRPKIGVLRSSRATRFGFSEPWNWDIARGALQAVGRNFAYLETPDILNGTIDQFPVVIDCGTVLLTGEEIEGIQRYVRRGGVFIAQHHTGRHSPEQGNSWALARAWGLTVEPRYMTDENYHKWPLAKMRFAAEQDLLKSLQGKEEEGSGVAVDYLGKEHSGAVNLVGKGERIRPVATWADGAMAIADVREGRGRFILLGTPFYVRMKDVAGVWVNDERRSAWLDEFLASLGVPRDSWTNAGEVWAELWRSKNGVFDLYPVARMTKQGDATRNATVALRRESPVAEVVEISSLGHPRIKVECKEGRLNLPAADYGLMQSRVFVAPRADLGRAALDWFRAQAGIWRALPPIPAEQQPQVVVVPEDLLPLPDGWTLKVEGQPDRTVRLGAFGTLSLPENTLASFEKSVAVPPAWKGRNIQLVFDAEHWFWGILPSARLLLNGKEAAIRQPIKPEALPGFAVDVTEAAAAGTLTIRLEVNGVKASTMRKEKSGQFKPHGVTGLFYLQATSLAVKVEPLPGAWQAASAFGRFAPVKTGEKTKCTYFETRFALPKDWPAKRLFLESSSHLGFLLLNGHALRTPAWMKRLDVSGMVRRDGGENVLRWVPEARYVPAWDRSYQGAVPEMKLVWME
ncbi:MAG: hypothetical protein NTW87_20155 [Planctomycetota bacterium]|nr:hypothetical protein [Planctomycetota bacterium]